METMTVRPLKDLNGPGRISVRGIWYHLVSASTMPVSMPSMMISAASSNISRESASSTPKERNSRRAAPRPMPRISRPSDRMSSSMACSTTRSGLFHGRMTAAVMSSIVLVLAAT